MDRPLNVTVHYEGAAFFDAVPPEARADEVLLRSLYHFGIDPREKTLWRLEFEGEERPRHGVYLDRAIGDQVVDGAELNLRRDVPGNRHLSTGNY